LKKQIAGSSINHLTIDNIQKAVYRAFDDAYNLLSTVDINSALRKKKKNTISQVSSFVRAQFTKKFKKVSYDDVETYSSDDEYDYKYKTDPSTNVEEEDTSDDEENLSSISASGKTHFHGMRVHDNIPSQSNSYFCVEIDGKKKFIHKQTACWLLTDQKSSLSSDRVKRVQQGN
jgi:hypothetical protein